MDFYLKISFGELSQIGQIYLEARIKIFGYIVDI